MRSQPVRDFSLHVVPALLYVVAVFVAGSAGDVPMPSTPVVSPDKIYHLFGFALMQLVLLRAIRWELPELRLERQLAAAAVVASLVGGLLELYQAALPHRSCDVFDWVADTLGAGLAALVVYGVASLRSSARPSLPPAG